MTEIATRSRAAVFVDLEGTVLEPGEFATGSGPMLYVRGACEALSTLARAGFTLVIVTNQSGLALGRFSRSQFTLRETLLQQHLHREVGVDVSTFMVCPHRPGADGKPACLCRKPAPGLLIRAARTQGLDLAESWMVGDMLDDIEAGRRAGCRTVLLQSAVEPAPQPSANLRTPHRRCSEWGEVADAVLAGRRRLHALP